MGGGAPSAAELERPMAGGRSMGHGFLSRVTGRVAWLVIAANCVNDPSASCIPCTKPVNESGDGTDWESNERDRSVPSIGHRHEAASLHIHTGGFESDGGGAKPGSSPRMPRHIASPAAPPKALHGQLHPHELSTLRLTARHSNPKALQIPRVSQREARKPQKVKRPNAVPKRVYDAGRR